MEEQIKRIVKSQKVQYISFWIIPLLLVLLGEAGVLPVGIKADNVRAVYVFETVGILMTAVCIPLSLKLFSFVLTKKIDQLTFPVKPAEQPPKAYNGSGPPETSADLFSLSEQN